jgi:putative endonuclease
MKEHNYSVYMVASKSRALYVGMINNLHRRIFEHKNDLIEGFTKQYKCHRLVYYESFDDVNKAIDRKKQLKRWNRTKKEWLIEQRNPTWEDLAAEWYLRHQLNRRRSRHEKSDLLLASSFGAASKQQVPPRADQSAELIDLLGRDDKSKERLEKQCPNALTSLKS